MARCPVSLLALLRLNLHTLGLAGPLGSAPTNFLYSFFFSALFIFFYLFLSSFYIVFSFLHYLFSSIYFWVIFLYGFFYFLHYLFLYSPKPWYSKRVCPICTRSASSFCRDPLYSFAHAMRVIWWYHAKFQHFQDLFCSDFQFHGHLAL